MKLNELRKAAAKADQELQIAESRAKDLQVKAKAAKARLQQARTDHKLARKAAKEAKKLAAISREEAREHFRSWEKAHKRLSKALKKLAKAGQAKKPPQAAAAQRKASTPRSGPKQVPETPVSKRRAPANQVRGEAPPSAGTSPATAMA